VAVDLPEMKQFGNLVEVASNNEAFLANLERVLSVKDSSMEIHHRQAFAAGQTWQHRARALISVTENLDNLPIVSVIVITYNNITLTRQCLHSLSSVSHYAAIEIIVVDNASSDGSIEFLSSWSAEHPERRKLILNKENRGFAAANNQGLAIASGEYLILLNNDTYVTPGWIQTLINHLRLDNTIGLIGPVTNNIGNEAKIDISYSDMNDMMRLSNEYTRRHIGQLFSLRTLAFFCVAMTRESYEKIGSLDEAFGLGFFEDDDYCRRVEQLGLRLVCAQDVFIHHELSASFNKVDQNQRKIIFDRNKAYYESKWGKWLPHKYRS
jgi:GT2 family glycosyltransferase